MKTIRAVTSFLLCLVFMMCTLVLQASLFTRVKLLEPKFYISSFEKYKLYSYIETSINDSLTDLGLYTNLPDSIFAGLVPGSFIKTQVDGMAVAVTDYLKYDAEAIPEIETNGQTEAFKSNLEAFIKHENVTVDEAAKKELEAVEKDVSNIVRNNISLVNLSGLSKSSAFQKVRRGLFYLYDKFYFAVTGALGLLLLLFLVNMKDASSGISWSAYSLIAAGFMLIIPSTAGIASNFMDNIAISDDTLRGVIVGIVNDSLMHFALSGAVAAAIGITVIVGQHLYGKSVKA